MLRKSLRDILASAGFGLVAEPKPPSIPPVREWPISRAGNPTCHGAMFLEAIDQGNKVYRCSTCRKAVKQK